MIKRREAKVEVSDHAVLKWLQKVEGVDIAAIKRKIARQVHRGAELSARSVTVQGVQFTLVNRPEDLSVVVTTRSRKLRKHLAVDRKSKLLGGTVK